MLKALIVDDEKKSRESLKILLEDFCKGVEVIGSADSVESAVRFVLENPELDLVFLDIRIGNEAGFDFLRKIPRINFQIIFTTAYTEYAIEAIKFSALDYLLKPIGIEDLQEAIVKAEKFVRDDDFMEKVQLLLENSRAENFDNLKLVLPTIDGLIFIRVKDILYCEASSNYTSFYMRDNKKHVVSKTLKEYESLLEKHGFFRIHNSYLINLREIKKYVKGEGGHVVLSNDKMLDVSKRRKETFLNRLTSTQIL